MASIEDDIVISCIRAVVVKTCTSAFKLCKFLSLRLLDTLGLTFNVIALCTVVRAPQLIYSFTHYLDHDKKNFKWIWRFGGFFQILVFLSDIPLLIMLFLEIIFPWRFYLLWTKVDIERDFSKDSMKDLGYEGFGIRKKILKQFVGLCTDMLVIPFSIVVFVSWRCVLAFREVKSQKTELKRKLQILVEFLNVILDLLCFVMFMVQCASWRLPVMVLSLGFFVSAPTFSSKEQSRFRLKIFKNFLWLLVDILMLPMFLLLLFSWRAPIVVKKLRIFLTYDVKKVDGRRYESPKRKNRELELRGNILNHFFRYCIDVVMLLPFLVTALSWRFPVLVLKFRKFFRSKMKRPDERVLRQSMLFQASQVFLDILTVPPMLVTICSWRLYFFLKIFPLDPQKSLGRKFKKVRLQFWKEAVRFAADIPVILMFILLCSLGLLCPWRLRQVFLEMNEIRNRYNTYLQNQNAKMDLEDCQTEIRYLIIQKFICMLVDMLVGIFALVILISVWRVPFFINKVKILKKKGHLSPSYKEAWRAVFKQFALLFVDIIMLILTLIIVVTLWRIPPLLRKVRKHAKYEENEKEDDDDDDDDDENIPAPVIISSCQYQNDSDKNSIIPTDIQSVQKTNFDEQEMHVHLQEVAEQDNGEKDSAAPLNSEPTRVIDSESGGLKVQDIEVQSTFWDRLFKVRGWKIRKAIILNIIGLLMDVPATILLIINIVSIYQIPFLVQRFMQCGNFYQEYFYIMVEETWHLLQDIAFFFIFLVMVVFRPKAAWVHLLEDKSHLKFRKSEEYNSQVQHIIKYRFKLPAIFETNLTCFVKYHGLHATSKRDITRKLCRDALFYTNEVKIIRDKVLERGLDEWLVYLLTCIIFYENKKPFLLRKRYEIEENYCLYGNAEHRKFELRKWKGYMDQIEGTLAQHYSDLETYTPTVVPLWTDTNGFLTRNRKQNQRVIIHTITSGYFGVVVLFFLSCLPLYRIPMVVKGVWRYRYCRYRVRDAILSQLLEYLLDVMYFLKALFVILFLYRTPGLISELSRDLFRRRSIKAARKTIDEYPVKILHDLGDLVCLLCRWDTFVFIFSSVLFILLIPLSVILNIFREGGCGVGCSVVISVPVYLALVSAPFITVFVITDVLVGAQSVSDLYIPTVISGYTIILAVILVLFVLVKTKKQNPDEKTVKIIDYVRFNWFNAQVIFMEVIEFIQLLAIVFSIKDLSIPYADTVATVSQYILLDVLPYKVKFGVATALFVIWVAVCTVPSLLEGVTKKVPRGYFSDHHYLWRSYLSFFGVVLFVTIPEIALSVLSCEYKDCGGMTTSPQPCPVLLSDPTISCWKDDHLIIAGLSFFMLMWYSLTALLYCTQYGETGNKKVDLQFSSSYSAVVNILKLLFIAGSLQFAAYRVPTLAFLLGVIIVIFVMSIVFERVTGIQVSNSHVLLAWRLASFIIVAIVIGGVLSYELYDDGGNPGRKNLILSSVIGGLITLVLIGTLILTKFVTRSSLQEKAREKFKKRLIRLIEYYEGTEAGLVPAWKYISRSYVSLLKSVRVANKNDKFVAIPEGHGIELDGIEMKLPSPPSYDAVVQDPSTSPPPYPASEKSDDDDENVDEGVTVDGIEQDPYFLPTSAMYLQPVGSYQSYDAEHILKDLDGTIDMSGGALLFDAGFQISWTGKSLDDTICIGSDLLLLFEEHISFMAYSYDFIVGLPEWRDKVKEANWLGLLELLEQLELNLDCSYDRSTKFSPGNITRMSHWDPSHIRPYVPPANISKLKLAIHQREVEKLMNLLPEPWLLIFRKLIPQKESVVPLIYRVSVEREDEHNIWGIKIEMFHELEITIKDIDPEGFKIAIGAKIILRNPIVISRIRKWNRRINFGVPFPSGRKGLLSHDITSCSCKMKKQKWSLVAAGKSVNLNKVLASLSKLELVFRDE